MSHETQRLLGMKESKCLACLLLSLPWQWERSRKVLINHLHIGNWQGDSQGPGCLPGSLLGRAMHHHLLSVHLAREDTESFLAQSDGKYYRT